MHGNNTIFAPATPVGESSITIVRLSGSDALSIAGKIFSKSKTTTQPEDINSYQSHTIHHGYLLEGNEIIDEVVLFIFRAPNSYTGEDVIEFSTHGGSFVFRKLSAMLCKYE